MAAKLNKKKARALLEQASLHRQRGEWDLALKLAAQVVEQSSLPEPAAFEILADGHERLGHQAEAEAALRKGLARCPSPALTAQLGSLLARGNRLEEGLALLEKVRAQLRRDPGYLQHLGMALMKAGRLDDSETVFTTALTLGKGGNDARLMLAVLKRQRGLFEEADALAAAIEAEEKGPLLESARAARADFKLFLGDPAAALERWAPLKAAGRLDPVQLSFMALAAELTNDRPLADGLIGERVKQAPLPEDWLNFAKISLHREQPAEALEHLEKVGEAGGEEYPGFEYELLAVRGRALRLLERRDEAHALLDEAAQLPEYGQRHRGPAVRIDRGLLAMKDGNFLAAEQFFREAVGLHPEDPQAKEALNALLGERTWKSSLEASADARLKAVQAEADREAARRHKAEENLEALQREVKRLKTAQKIQERKAEQAKAGATAAAEQATREKREQLAQELLAREQEVEAKVAANIERALDGVASRCPPDLRRPLEVAERSFQRALNEPEDAAAPALFFSAALERGMNMLIVRPFDRWLGETGRRQAFLEAAVSERRGRRVEYVDHFVEAFDQDNPGKPPSLGEVGRVLRKLDEPYLDPLGRFLSETYGAPRSFYPELADLMIWAKEKLRDRVAHGFVDVGYSDLKLFREQLLFGFKKYKRGALAVLLQAPK